MSRSLYWSSPSPLSSGLLSSSDIMASCFRLLMFLFLLESKSRRRKSRSINRRKGQSRNRSINRRKGKSRNRRSRRLLETEVKSKEEAGLKAAAAPIEMLEHVLLHVRQLHERRGLVPQSLGVNLVFGKLTSDSL